MANDASKDAKNLEQIDNQINKDIAKDVSTEEINIATGEAPESADPTQGHINEGVKDNEAAQAAANAAEIPDEEAPSTVEEAKDTLKDLGIN